jgi:hypothetical protein
MSVFNLQGKIFRIFQVKFCKLFLFKYFKFFEFFERILSGKEIFKKVLRLIKSNNIVIFFYNTNVFHECFGEFFAHVQFFKLESIKNIVRNFL